MASNTESQTSGSTQTQEGGGSYYLQQCMNVMKTFAEFSNLTYRITHTFKDVEVMTIYRNRLLGVFGPTVEPITLTIDPSGCCLVSVLFKPVKRVSLIEAGSGGLDILSLLALLRMIAGKGYFFCPGLPEKFVSGKACGRYVELHRAPFKRFQSPQCPVYYQPKTEEKRKDQQESTDSSQKKLSESSIFKMCPQCRQVGMLVKRLPPAVLAPARGVTSASVPKSTPPSNAQESMPSNAPLATLVPTGAITTTTSQPTITLGGQLISITMPSTGLVVPFQQIQPSVSGTEVSQSLVTLPSPASLPALPLLQIGQSMNKPVVTPPALPPLEKQNRQHWQPGLAKLAESLANKKIGQKEVECKPAIAAADPTVSSSVTLKSAVKEPGTAKKRGRKSADKSNKNVCKVCDKTFSTPASLLNHLQRHEGSLPKSLKTKLAPDKKESSSKAVLRMMIRSGKKKSAVSETSLRLFSKCLDDLMASRGDFDSKPLKKIAGRKPGRKMQARHNKMLSDEYDTSLYPASDSEQLPAKISKGRDETDVDSPSAHHSRPTLEKRGSSGLSVQALLMAASLDSNDPGSPLVSSLAPTGFDSETTGYSSRPASRSSQDETSETKQHRKSPRIASRRRKKELAEQSERERSASSTPDTAVLPIIHNQLPSSVAAMRPTPLDGNPQPQVMHDPAPLTNLDLLSSVSVDKAFREKNSPVPTSLQGGKSIPNPQTCVNNSNTLQRVPNIPMPFSPLQSSAAGIAQSQSTSHSYKNLNHLLTKPSANPQDLRNPRPDFLPSPGVRGTIVPPPLFFARPGKDGRLIHPIGPMTPIATNSGPLRGPVMPTTVRPHGKPSNGDNSAPIFSPSSQPMPPLIQTTQQGFQTVEQQARQNCGAIDLSKPKPPAPRFHSASKQPNAAKDISQIPSTLIPFGPLTRGNALPQEMLVGSKAANLAFPSLPVSQAKPPVSTILATAAHPTGMLPNRARLPEPALAELHQNPASGIRVKQPVSSASIPHVQAMMLSQGPFPGQLLSPGKKVASADEIQCGYKWSGSGGQVKERTQMVREIVPRDVMASFLNKQVQQLPIPPDDSKKQDKPTSSEQSAQEFSSPPFPELPVSKPQEQELKSIPLSLPPEIAAAAIARDHVSRQLALNLSKSKRKSEVISESTPSPARTATRAKKQKKGSHTGNKPTEPPDVVIIDVDQNPATSAMQSILTAPSVSGSYPAKVRIRVDKSKPTLVGRKDQVSKPLDQSKVTSDMTPITLAPSQTNKQVLPSKANSEPRRRGRGAKSFRQYRPTLKTTATHSPSLAAILTQSNPASVQGFSPPHLTPVQQPAVSDHSGPETAAMNTNMDQTMQNGKQKKISRQEQHHGKKSNSKGNSSNVNSNASKYSYNNTDSDTAVTTAPCWVLLPPMPPVKTSGSGSKAKTSPAAQAIKEEPVICISPPPPPLLHEGTEMITMALPIKKERRESEKKPQRERDGSISPSKLVMDFQMDEKDNKKPIKHEG